MGTSPRNTASLVGPLRFLPPRDDRPPIGVCVVSVETNDGTLTLTGVTARRSPVHGQVIVKMPITLFNGERMLSVRLPEGPYKAVANAVREAFAAAEMGE